MALQDFVAATARAATALMGGVPITYRIPTGTVFDPASGQTTPTQRDVACRAWAANVGVQDVQPGGAGPVQIGDVLFEVVASELDGPFSLVDQTLGRPPGTTKPGTSHLILAGGQTYRIVMVEQRGSGTVYRITTRKQT